MNPRVRCQRWRLFPERQPVSFGRLAALVPEQWGAVGQDDHFADRHMNLGPLEYEEPVGPKYPETFRKRFGSVQQMQTTVADYHINRLRLYRQSIST